LVLVAMLAASARAEDFAWNAPASCPTRPEVLARIERRFGAPLAGGGVVVDVTHTRAEFTATIDLRALTLANDVRTLTAPSCSELADAVAVIVARVATQTREAQPATTTVASLDPPPDRTDTPVSTAIALAPPPPRPTHRWGGGLHVLGLSGIGGVPDVGLGGEVGLYVRRDAVYADVSYARWAASSAYVYEGAPARVDVDLALVALRAGWGPEHLPIRAWGMIETGTMSGIGVDLANPMVGSGTWTAAGAGFGVAWPMSKWARVIGSVEFVVPFQRVTFELEGNIAVYRSWPMSSRACFGLEVGFK